MTAETQPSEGKPENSRNYQKRMLRVNFTKDVAGVLGLHEIDEHNIGETIYQSEPQTIEVNGKQMQNVVVRRTVSDFPGVRRLWKRLRGVHHATNIETSIVMLGENGKETTYFEMHESFEKYAWPSRDFTRDVIAITTDFSKPGGSSSEILEDLGEAIQIVAKIKELNPSTSVLQPHSK